jgi:opacity protein-like surface antigen
MKLNHFPILATTVIFNAPLLAADLGIGTLPPMYTSAPEAPVELGTGWYLRGAIGRSLDGTLDFEVPGIGRGQVPVRNDVIGEAAIGYQLNNWMRGDISLEGSRAKSTTASLFNVHGNRVGVFANAFLDLGTWNHFSPYFGAGVGYAKTSVEATAPLGQLPLLPVSQIAIAHTAPAWALMAGVAYKFDRNAAVTVEYRFANYGAYSGSSTAAPGIAVISQPVKEQQIRVGFRYLVD